MKILAKLIDYSFPTLALSKEEQFEIGMWWQRYRRHLKENHHIIYYNYLTKGTLNKHLKEIDTRADEMFQQLVKSLARKKMLQKVWKPKIWCCGFRRWITSEIAQVKSLTRKWYLYEKVTYLSYIGRKKTNNWKPYFREKHSYLVGQIYRLCWWCSA